MRQVWDIGAVLNQKGEWDLEKFCSRYERPLQVTDVSLPGMLLQKGLYQTEPHMELWTIRRSMRYMKDNYEFVEPLKIKWLNLFHIAKEGIGKRCLMHENVLTI